jgi:hypothetical protein
MAGIYWMVELQIVDGAPGEIRTPDPLVRSQVLYPAELRARREGGIIHKKTGLCWSLIKHLAFGCIASHLVCSLTGKDLGFISEKIQKPRNGALYCGGDGGIRTLDTGFVRMLP